MKYTFEIMKEYEDAFKGISVYSVSEEKKLMVDFVAREELEDAQKKIDEAYHRGYDKGYADKTNFDEVSKELAKDAYQRGLDAAWEAAKKLSWTEKYGGYGDCLDKVFDRTDTFDFLEYSPNEAIAKLKAYEEKQKAEDDIKLGDVLEHTVSGYTSKAIFLEKIEDDEDWYKCLFWTGCGLAILSYPKSQFKRIGKHFDIDKILEEMKE